MIKKINITLKDIAEAIKPVIRENEELKQQLAEKDRKIERLKQDYDEVWEDTYFSVKEDFELNNNCNECRRYYAEEFNKQLDQDKISFCIEQLEKVKEKAIKPKDCGWCDKYKDCWDIVMDIDNQINQLKEGK